MKFLCIVIAGIVLGISAALAGPLHDAAKDGDVERAKQLLDQGADVVGARQCGRAGPAYCVAGRACRCRRSFAGSRRRHRNSQQGWPDRPACGGLWRKSRCREAACRKGSSGQRQQEFLPDVAAACGSRRGPCGCSRFSAGQQGGHRSKGKKRLHASDPSGMARALGCGGHCC